MIADAVLSLVSAVLNALGALLPEDTLDIPSLSGLGSWFGESIAPFDRWFPISELAAFLILMTGVWMPAATVYVVTTWIYRHLPVIGKG